LNLPLESVLSIVNQGCNFGINIDAFSGQLFAQKFKCDQRFFEFEFDGDGIGNFLDAIDRFWAGDFNALILHPVFKDELCVFIW